MNIEYDLLKPDSLQDLLDMFGNPLAEQQLQDLRVGFNRYEKIRKLSVAQFSELYKKNITTGIPFDDLVDGVIQE